MGFFSSSLYLCSPYFHRWTPRLCLQVLTLTLVYIYILLGSPINIEGDRSSVDSCHPKSGLFFRMEKILVLSVLRERRDRVGVKFAFVVWSRPHRLPLSPFAYSVNRGASSKAKKAKSSISEMKIGKCLWVSSVSHPDPISLSRSSFFYCWSSLPPPPPFPFPLARLDIYLSFLVDEFNPFERIGHGKPRQAAVRSADEKANESVMLIFVINCFPYRVYFCVWAPFGSQSLNDLKIAFNAIKCKSRRQSNQSLLWWG